MTETWLNDTNPKGTLTFKGYKHIRKDRGQAFKQKYKKNNGGGVAIIYKETLKVKLQTELNEDDDEVLWASIRVTGNSYLIGAIYRPDYSDLLEGQFSALEKHLQNAFQQSSNIIIIGDLNVDVLNPVRQEDRTLKQRLDAIFDSFDMHQIIKNPTRVTYKTASLIDHIWVSSNCKIGDSNTTDGVSDHHAIYAELKVPMDRTNKKLKARTYKQYDRKKIVKEYEEEIEKSKFRELLRLGKN